MLSKANGFAKSNGSVKQKREFSIANEHIYNRSGPVRWILSHLLRYPHLMVSFFLAATLTNVVMSIIPRLTGRAFDEVLKPSPDPNQIIRIALTILGLMLMRGVLDITNSWSVETLGQRLERDSREELYVSLLGKSQTFHNRQRVGDIMARATNDVRQLNPMMNPGVSLITESIIGIIAPMVFIAILRPELLVAPIAFVIAYIFALRRYVKKLNPVADEQRWRFGEMNAGMTETITGIEVVKSAVQEEQERR